jgi:hypothetical protein
MFGSEVNDDNPLKYGWFDRALVIQLLKGWLTHPPLKL